jgi:hypothetical protein
MTNDEYEDRAGYDFLHSSFDIRKLDIRKLVIHQCPVAVVPVKSLSNSSSRTM